MSRLLQKIEAHARERPDAPALSGDGIRLTYQDLVTQSAALAERLRARGFREGDCLGCLKTSMIPVVVAGLAALRLGVAIAPLDARETASKIAHVFETARVKQVLAQSKGAVNLAAELGFEAFELGKLDMLPSDTQILPRPSEDRIWSVEPTSGSSGVPKLVPLSAAVLDHYINAHASAANLGPQDRVALFGEMWFDTVFSNFWAGSHALFYDFRGKGASALVDWLRSHEITGFQSYPVAFRAIVGAAKERLPALRFARLAGEALLPRDVAEFERVFAKDAVLTNSYGSTECGLLACYDFVSGAPRPQGPLPAGYPPVPGELSVVDDAGQPVAQGVAGTILKRSRYLAEHYLNNPEKSEGVYWTEADGTRCLLTGDIGYFDSKGCLHLIGRVDDQVKIRGYSVRYSEVEAELSKEGHFAELAVTSWMSPFGARQLVCHYVLNADGALDVPAYRAALLRRLPAYMVPNYFIAHQALPKTDSGKISRKALPSPDTQDLPHAEGAAAFSAPEREICDIWQRVLGHRNYTAQDDFFDIGGDSLQAMAVLVALEERFKVRLGYESFVMQGASIAQIAQRIEQADSAPIVTLKRGELRPPVFVMPVENGEFSDWLYMMNALGQGRSYFGVHVRDVAERTGFERLSVAELAGHACDTIEAQHGLGPMVIAGFSAGSLLALEAARELNRRGAEDVGLILVEPTAGHLQKERFDWWARRILSPLIKQRDFARCLNRAGHIFLRRPARELPIADETAFRNYAPQNLWLNKALIISCLEENPHKTANEAYWQDRLYHRATCLDAPGNHTHVLRDPNAERLVQRLEDWISENFA
ncbi:AMP-binding protein [uncultured Lentibacter sp.]|uniref:AMP-binding protein n=1 Tax=uncultured Lentibacter sp. TaxID=1659309 RepID=UPI00262B2177|nr:AMP-binding protein [uncultured Lentibacter sp.]